MTELTVDNPDSTQMIEYLESRVDALRLRIQELEQENRELREGKQ